MFADKRGEMAWDEILGIVLGAGAVLIMAILMFRLLAPGFDVNKEYAEGVYAKLERAAAEADDVGFSEFSILDVPVDYGDSVFLVLFEGDDEHVVLSRYPVEIRNSDFMTYVKRSAGPLMSESRRVYYSFLKNEMVSSGVESDVAEKAARGASPEITERVAVDSVKNMDNFIFGLDMDYAVSEFAKKTGLSSDEIAKGLEKVSFEGLSPAGKISLLKKVLAEVSESSIESVDDIFWSIEKPQIIRNFVTTSGVKESADSIIREFDDVGKGLANYERRVVALKNSLGKYVPEGKVGRYKSMDSFMNSARGISKYNTRGILGKEAAFNIQAQKVIGQSVGVDDVERVIKEMTDETFAKKILGADGKMRFLTPDEKAMRLRSILGSSADDVLIDGIKDMSGKDALKLAMGTTDDVSDDILTGAIDRIVAVKSIPANDVVDDIVEGAVRKSLKSASVADDVAVSVSKKVAKGSGRRAIGLTGRISLRVVGAAFLVWEAYEYYNVAHGAQAWVATALNNEEVSINDWVAVKLLQKNVDGDTLCVCYVDDDYRRNVCSMCVEFDKPIATNPVGENLWTFCERIVLKDRGGDILLSSYVKENCRPSVAFTNDECKESSINLKSEVDNLKTDLAGLAAGTATAGSYGLLMGGIGGLVGGGIGVFFGGAGAVPGAILGAKMGVAIGVLAGEFAGYEGVTFSCDERGHIYLGKVTG